MTNAALAPVFAPFLLQGFWEAFGLVTTIIVFILLYKLFYPDVVDSQLIGLIMAAVITYLIVIPYEWFKYLLFVILFMYAFFWEFRPWEWGVRRPRKAGEYPSAGKPAEKGKPF